MSSTADSNPSGSEWRDVRELVARATPEQAWRAWADPEIIAGWFADRAEGTAEVGGTLVHVFDAMGFSVRYDVIASEPGKLLVLGGNMHGVEFEQRIEVAAEEVAGEGQGSRIRVIHSGFGDADPQGEISQGIDSGWKLALAVLRHYLEQHFAAPKRGAFQFRPAEYEYDALAPLYHEQLDRWLTRSSTPIVLGERVQLEFWDGQVLDGEVIADSGRELALTWPQMNGVLELKAFSMGPAGRAVGLRAFTWETAPPAADALDAWLSMSLDRLLAAL